MNLRSHVNIIQILNIDSDASTLSAQQLLSTDNTEIDSYILSDVDEEIIILVEFKEFVNLQSIKLCALSFDENNEHDTSPPKQVHVYKLDNISKNFEDLKSIKPDKTVKCSSKKLTAYQSIKLKKIGIRFKKTRYLAIYIESNQNDTEKTHLNGIKLNGQLNENKQDNISVNQDETVLEVDLSILSKKHHFNKNHNEEIVFDTNEHKNRERFREMSTLYSQQTESFNRPDSTCLLDSTQVEMEQKSAECVLSECPHLKRLCNSLMIYHTFTAQNLSNDQTAEPKTIQIEDENQNNDTSNVLCELRRRQYIFKQLNEKENSMICLNDEFENVSFSLEHLDETKLNQIKHIIKQGENIKKDVAIMVVEMELKNLVVVQRVSDATIMDDENNSVVNQITNGFDCDIDLASILNDFHHLIQVHAHQFEDIYNILVKQCNFGDICALEDCFMMRRNHRDRFKLCEKDQELKQLYFNCNDTNDIIQQQILDKIHCHFFHSFDIGYKLTDTHKQKLLQQFQDQKQQESDVYEDLAFLLCKQIKYKQESFRNVAGLQRLSDSAKFSTVMSSTDPKLKYSFGFRFFYWKFYMHSVVMMDPVQEHTSCKRPDGNVGYYTSHTKSKNNGLMLGELFIFSKFKDLKVELLNNPICCISLLQWHILAEKASMHCTTNYYKTIVCDMPDAEKYYNIKEGSKIGCSHLIALLTYCNQDVLQCKFSETFRLISENESLSSLNARHSNYAHLGRLLREFVECFGSDFGKNSWTDDFYWKGDESLFHGISIQTQFSSTDAYINGPVSTSKKYEVAITFSQFKGMILEFELGYNWKPEVNKGYRAVECQCLSDFSNEQEVFFIGGYYKFSFKDIINISEGASYKLYLAALTAITRQMYEQNSIDRENGGTYYSFQQEWQFKQICFRIICHQLHEHYPDDTEYYELKNMPSYIKQLTKKHFASIEACDFSYGDNSGDCPIIVDLFRSLFFYDNGVVNLDRLTTVFPSLYTVRISRYRFLSNRKGVNAMNCESMYLSVLWLLKNKKNLKLKQIIIDVPIKNPDALSALKNMISKFNAKFRQIDWVLYIQDQGWSMNAKHNYIFMIEAITNESLLTDVRKYVKRTGTVPQIIGIKNPNDS